MSDGFLITVLRRFVPWRRIRRQTRREGRPKFCEQSRFQAGLQDVEAPGPATRSLVAEGEHAMWFQGDVEDENAAFMGYDTSRSSEGAARNHSDMDLVRAIEERQQRMTQVERDQEKEDVDQAVASICHATSASSMLDEMDTLIKDDWLGGFDSMPGNIYSVAALTLTSHLGPKSVARKLGFLSVFLIQLLGPPLIFIQMWTGNGVEEEEKIHWDKFQIFDLSDWHTEPGNWIGSVNITKIVAFLFINCFCLNGLFCHMDERESWIKLDRIFNILNKNGYMQGTCECLMKLGAFMNSWVIIWLIIDMFFVLGTAGTVIDVLMDALGLAFLYNLDDISGDLGFIDEDDWPGLHLSWLDHHIKDVAERNDEVDEDEASIICNYFLNFVTYVLALMWLILPFMFIVTPFKAMVPGSSHLEIKDEEWLAAFIRNTVNGTAKAAAMAAGNVSEL